MTTLVFRGCSRLLLADSSPPGSIINDRTRYVTENSLIQSPYYHLHLECRLRCATFSYNTHSIIKITDLIDLTCPSGARPKSKQKACLQAERDFYHCKPSQLEPRYLARRCTPASLRSCKDNQGQGEVSGIQTQ